MRVVGPKLEVLKLPRVGFGRVEPDFEVLLCVHKCRKSGRVMAREKQVMLRVGGHQIRERDT